MRHIEREPCHSGQVRVASGEENHLRLSKGEAPTALRGTKPCNSTGRYTTGRLQLLPATRVTRLSLCCHPPCMKKVGPGVNQGLGTHTHTDTHTHIHTPTPTHPPTHQPTHTHTHIHNLEIGIPPDLLVFVSELVIDSGVHRLDEFLCFKLPIGDTQLYPSEIPRLVCGTDSFASVGSPPKCNHVWRWGQDSKNIGMHQEESTHWQAWLMLKPAANPKHDRSTS